MSRNNIANFPVKSGLSSNGNGQEPPMDLVERVARLEQKADDLKERLIRVETRLDTFATKTDLSDLKADMHKSFTEQTRWIIIAMATLIAITTAVQKFSPPQADRQPIVQSEK